VIQAVKIPLLLINMWCSAAMSTVFGKPLQINTQQQQTPATIQTSASRATNRPSTLLHQFFTSFLQAAQ
jgi:hypothetical protein